MNGTVTPIKGQHPADGSDRWSVTGEDGKVVYDLLGNHVAIIDADGEVLDAMGKAFSNRVREYAQLDDDDAVFAVLASLYAAEFGVFVTLADPQTKADRPCCDFAEATGNDTHAEGCPNGADSRALTKQVRL